MANIPGTPGNDNIAGTGDDDLITGGVGNDTIEAGAGNDTIIGDGGDSSSAGGVGGLGGQLDSERRVDGDLYGRFSGTVYDGQFNFTTHAFYLGDDIGVLDGANRNELRGQVFTQDGSGNSRVAELVDIDFTGAQKSYVGLATVQRTALHEADDQFSASNGDGFQDVVVVNDVDVIFKMNDGTVYSDIRMQFLRGDDGKTYLLADDHPQEGTFNSIRTTVYQNDSGIESMTIQSSSGNINGINPIVGNWAAGQYIAANPVGDSLDDVLCGNEGDDIIYGDGGDSATAAGFGVAGGLLDTEERVDGDLYGRFSGRVYDGEFNFSSDAFYLGDDIGVLDGANRNELRGQVFTQDGSGNSRVAELVDIDYTGAQKSFVGLATVQRTALHGANDQFSASNGDGFQDVVIVNDVDVTFTMNDGTVFQHIRMQFLRGDDGKTYLIADDHPQEGTFNSIRTTVYRNDSGIESMTIESSSGNINGINPIVGNWAAGQFKVTQDGEGGDDIIKGGAGSDTMFGEGGDDIFVVESAADGAGDVVVGGNGPDQNTDTDVLDLRGAGVVTIDDAADANDAGARAGTVTFNNGETLTFEGIEEILQDEPALTIAPAPGTPTDPATGNPLTAENGTPAQIVITRNTPTDQPLEVFLTDGDPSETDAPVSVIIPAGQSSVTVDIPSVDDLIVDGDQVSTITATAPGLESATQDVTVADDDTPELTIEPGPNQPVDPATGLPVTQENGDPIELVITRNGPTDEPLVVTLTDGDPSETDTPTTVTIPAGQDSVTVLVDPVDDPEVDGDQTAPITATAPGYPDAVQDVLVEDDDTPALTIEPAPGTPTDPATGNPLTAENGTPAQIVITRNTPTDQPLEVFLTDGDPSETDAPVSVIIPAGQSSVTVEIPSVDDLIVDGDQVSTITATAPGLESATQDVTVADDDTPELTIEPGPNQPVDPATGLPVTQENGDPIELVITRNGPTDEPLVVTLTDGDPSETDTPTTVTIPAGQDSVTVLVDPVDDPEVDGDQTAPITATAPGYPETVQDVLVEDDDTPALTIEPAPGTPTDPATGNPLTAENGTPAQIVITRNTPTDQPLEVFLTDGDPSETDAPVSVIIPAGQSSVTVEIPSVDDLIVDGDQVSTITATAPGLESATQDVTVADDDTPELTIEPGPNQPVDPATGLPVTQENGDPIELVITRNGPTDEPLVVTLTDGDPSETDTPTTVTIPAGQDSVTVLVDPVDDPEVDGDQTAPITATAPGYPETVQDVLVEDDDTPALTIEPAPGTPTDPATGNPLTAENGTPAQIVITRNTPTDQPLEVFLTDGDPSETDAPVSVIIPAGQSSVTVEIPSVDDLIVDGDQVSTITATAPGLESATQDVTVADDDTPELTIEPGPNQPVDPATGLPVTQENGDPIELVITRNGPTDEPLVVTLTDGDPSETDTPTTVTIPAGQDSVTVLVDPVDDPEVDGDQTAPITATAPGYPETVQDVLVEDDDTPELTIEPGPNQPVDPATGLPVTQENGDPVELVITRNGPTDEPLVVTLTDGDPSETDTPTTVTIPAGQDSVTVLVDPVDDPEVDGDQTAPITATAPGYPDAVQDVLVEDDDVDEPMVLTIEPGPDATLDSEGRPELAENGEPSEIVISRSGPTDQPLLVMLSSDDPTEATVPMFAVIPAGETSVTVPVSPEDDLIVDGTEFPTLTATADGFTPAEIEVSVADDDGLTLTIEPGPDATLDSEGRPELAENGEPSEIVISRSGPTDQPLLVMLSSDDPTEATVPMWVVIMPGETSITVPVNPEDDLIVDGTEFPTLTATATGFTPAKIEVSVADDDEPTLTIEPGPDATLDSEGRPELAENGEPSEIVISRSGPTDQPLLVMLSSDDPTEATVPMFAVIPAGETSVTVPVSPEDDLIVDGTEFPTLTATADGFTPAEIEVSVADDDGLTLTIEPGPDATLDSEGRPELAENGEPSEIVISRSGPTDQPLLVMLSSDDPTEATVPMWVVIMPGETSITVPVNPEDDLIVDGTEFPTLTATATGFAPAEIEVSVADDDGAQSNSVIAVNDSYELQLDDVDPGDTESLGNVLDNDSDPNGDFFVFQALEGDNTPDANGWFGWVDGSEGGEFRVNQTGDAQFRYTDTDFVNLNGMIETEVSYTILDALGATDTARISVEVEAESDCGCGSHPVHPDDYWVI